MSNNTSVPGFILFRDSFLPFFTSWSPDFKHGNYNISDEFDSAHNWSFNEPTNCGILRLIFQITAIKFGINVGINLILNISPGFYQNY